MTITLGWWAVPLVICLFGIVAVIVSSIWDEQSGGGGDYGQLGNGCAGMAICIVCFMVAGGICIGHWIA